MDTTVSSRPTVAGVATLGTSRPANNVAKPSTVAGLAVVPNRPLIMVGVTAELDLSAPSGAGFTLGGDMVLTGVTSTLSISAQGSSGPVLTVGDGAITLAGVTSRLTLSAGAGSFQVGGSALPGDSYASPTAISGTGSKATTSTGYTVEASEPASTLSVTLARSRWYVYQGAGNSVIFTLTSSATGSDYGYLEVWDASGTPSDPSSWVYQGGGSAQSGTPVSTDAIYVPAAGFLMIRVSASSDGQTNTLSYAVSTPPSGGGIGGSTNGNIDTTNGQVDLYTLVLDETPSSVLFGAMNAVPEGFVTVSLNGTQLASKWADETGVIVGATVDIPELQPGTYQLSFSGAVADCVASFQVLAPPAVYPVEPAADTTTTAPALPHRWMFRDPAGVLADYTLPFNPATMTSPWAPRPYTPDQTTAPDGTPIVWQGAHRQADWSFSGYLREEVDFTAFKTWAALNRRFWVIDHRDRVWVVSFTSLDLQPKRAAGYPYSMTYTVNAAIFRQES